MKKSRKLFICLALGFFLATAPPAAFGQGKWWQTERYQKELALTADQITRIEAIYQTTAPSLRVQREALDKLERKLSKVLSDSKSDEAMVLEAAERVEAARAELSRTRTLQLFRVRRILTDEQNAKMKELHERDRRERDRKPKGDGPDGCE